MVNGNKSFIPPTPKEDEYGSGSHDTESLGLEWIKAADPIKLFEDWLSHAGKTELNDANAMSLSTIDAAGCPDVRIVLLKGLDQRGFVFFTNSQSAKGAQLLATHKAALCFHWKSLKRQIRVRGDIAQIADHESDDYFAQRARGSQIGAWASAQSQPVKDRAAMLAMTTDYEARFKDKAVPRPPHWYGWRLHPSQIEFWQDGAYRLHDRILFTKAADNWTKQRLFP